MTVRNPRRAVAAILGLAGAALPLASAGVASAAEAAPSTADSGYPSTQSPTQGADTGSATLGNALASIMDANDGPNRPDDADGTDTQYPQPDPRFVEGPAGGLLTNGPLE